MPLESRLSWVIRFRRLIAASEQRLVRLMGEEVRRPPHEALLTDLAPLLANLRWLEDNGPRLLRDRDVAGSAWGLPGTRAIERRLALGRVGIIATWSYPVLSLGSQVAHALVAGNTVVVKPSEKCPKTHTRMLELAVEAGLPAGVLSWTGASREAGANMLMTQDFDHVVFTGSVEVGQRIAQSCAKSMTSTTLELTGRDSVFVLEDADARKAARAVWGALCLHAGQGTTSPRRILVLDKAYEKFIKEIIRLASNAPEMAMIDEASSLRCRELVSKALGRGARDAGLLTPMPPKLGSNLPREEQTTAFRVTALIDCDPSMEVVEGRHFGPLAAVLKCANLAEAIAIHHRCDQHVAASIFTKKAAYAAALGRRLGVTNVTYNDCSVPYAHPGVAFGGMGASGSGVIGGEEGLLGMTRPAYLTMSRYRTARFAAPIAQWKIDWTSRALRWWHEASRAKRHDLGKVLPTGTSTLPATESDRALVSAMNPTNAVSHGAPRTAHQPAPAAHSAPQPAAAQSPMQVTPSIAAEARARWGIGKEAA